MRHHILHVIGIALSVAITGCTKPEQPAAPAAIIDRFTESHAKASANLFLRNAELSWQTPTNVVRSETNGVIQYAFHYATPARELTTFGPRTLVVERPTPGERRTTRVVLSNSELRRLRGER
jgi:hypothetical protein